MSNFFAIFSLLLIPPVLSQEGTIVAFGDWGSPTAFRAIMRLNYFLTLNIRSDSRRDFVCLLGDNFYPSGINPKLGFNDPKFRLFSDILAGNLSTTFLATIGNHDYVQRGGVGFQYNYSRVDDRWLMGAPLATFASKPPLGGSTRPICVWQIDSISIHQTYITALDTVLSRLNCRFKIIISHYPVFTFGQYQEDEDVLKFQSYILPILTKHKIHLFLSGHEHSAQLISHSSLPTKFVIAGSPINVRDGHIRRGVTLDKKRNATLEWFNDRTAGIVSRIKYNTTTLQVDFVDIWSLTVLTTVFIDA